MARLGGELKQRNAIDRVGIVLVVGFFVVLVVVTCGSTAFPTLKDYLFLSIDHKHLDSKSKASKVVGNCGSGQTGLTLL